MRVTRWTYMSVALGLSVSSGACGGGDDGAGPGGGLSGSYALAGVNEDGLPLQLFEDGTWEMTIDFDRVEQGDSQTLEGYGDYDRDGDDLWFVSDAYEDEFEGTLDGNEVLVTYDFDGDGEYESDFVFVE